MADKIEKTRDAGKDNRHGEPMDGDPSERFCAPEVIGQLDEEEKEPCQFD